MMKDLLPHECISTFIITYKTWPIAKMFIAIVNTCSLYSLLLFVLVALFPWWAPSRVKTPVPYKHKATGIDASTTIIVAVVSLCGFAHAHGHMNMLHKWSSSIAASTTIAAASSMLSGHVTHLTTWREVALYGVNTKDAAGLAALHVVCTNRVALLQRLLCWPTVWRPHHDHVRRRAHSCRTSMRRPSGWLWGLSSPFCAPRRSMVQADASHQRTTSAAASLPYIDDTSPVSMPIWVQNEHSFAYLCKNSNISSIFFGTEKTARFFSQEAVKMFSLFGT